MCDKYGKYHKFTEQQMQTFILRIKLEIRQKYLHIIGVQWNIFIECMVCMCVFSVNEIHIPQRFLIAQDN